jgi:two-component system LytT family response regulator
MNCLIVEDEKVAAKRLVELINKYDSSMEVLEVLQTVKSATAWLQKNPPPELIFMDIQLADGLSFEIFEQVLVESPIIFTTAYDEYALKAFKVNSIDYLLKPLDYSELSSAISRLKVNRQTIKYPQQVFDAVLKSLTNEYKGKFVIKVGEHIRIIQTNELACIYSLEKSTFLQTIAGRNYAINYSLDQVETLLDPKKFFRINRQYLLSFNAISDIVSYSNSRLLIRLIKYESDDLIVSREKVQKFKEWLEG